MQLSPHTARSLHHAAEPPRVRPEGRCRSVDSAKPVSNFSRTRHALFVGVMGQQVHVSALAGWIMAYNIASPDITRVSYLAGYGFPVPFGRQPSLLGPSFPAGDLCRRCRWPTRLVGILPLSRRDPSGVSTFRTCEGRPGWVPSILRGHGVLLPDERGSGSICGPASASWLTIVFR